MKTILAIIGAIALLLILGLFALCNDDEGDPDSFGRARIVLASHDYGGDDCWDYGDCGGYDERNGGYGDGRGGDGRFGGGRSGDYDGGDGDGDRCRNICNNTFPMPGSGQGGGR